MADFLLRKPVHTPDGAHDFGRILETSSRDKAHLNAATRDERVGRNRATMLEQDALAKELRTVHIENMRCFRQCVHYAPGEVVGSSGSLRGPDLAVPRHHDDISEGSSGIDSASAMGGKYLLV